MLTYQNFIIDRKITRGVCVLSSLIFFFFGFGYSYFFYKNAQRTYEITVGSDESFVNEKIHYFYVWNSGKETIYKEDLLNESKCLEVILKGGNLVEYAKISDVTSDYFKIDLYQERKKVKIDFDLLRPDEGFTMMVKTRINSPSYWDLQIKQKKNILVLPNIIKARGFESNLNLFSNILHFSVLSMIVYIAFFVQKIDFASVKTTGDYIRVIMPYLYLVVLIPMLPILTRRIKAPRPPMELELHFVKNNIERQKIKNVLKRLWTKKLKRWLH